MQLKMSFTTHQHRDLQSPGGANRQKIRGMVMSVYPERVVITFPQFAHNAGIDEAPEPFDSILSAQILQEFIFVSIQQRAVPLDSFAESAVEIFFGTLAAAKVNRQVKVRFLRESPVKRGEVL